jgi:CRP/FNR family transcriptional regulator
MPMIKKILKNIELFKSLDDNQINRLVEISNLEKFDKDYILFHQGDISKYLYVLISGAVNIYKSDDLGNPIIIGIFSEPSLLGEAAILQQIPFPSTAICKTDVSILKIDLEYFINDFLNDINIAKQIIYSLLGKVQLLQQNIHNNIAPNASEKILNFYAQNNDFAQNLKQYEIAALLGITPETFSRNIKQLIKEKKLIKDGKNYILI